MVGSTCLIQLSTRPRVHQPITPSVYLSNYLSIYLSHPSGRPSIHLSVYLCIYVFLFCRLGGSRLAQRLRFPMRSAARCLRVQDLGLDIVLRCCRQCCRVQFIVENEAELAHTGASTPVAAKQFGKISGLRNRNAKARCSLPCKWVHQVCVAICWPFLWTHRF